MENGKCSIHNESFDPGCIICNKPVCKDYINYFSRLFSNPYRNLCAAVLNLAVLDANGVNEKALIVKDVRKRSQALEFIFSKNVEYWIEIADLGIEINFLHKFCIESYKKIEQIKLEESKDYQTRFKAKYDTTNRNRKMGIYNKLGPDGKPYARAKRNYHIEKIFDEVI